MQAQEPSPLVDFIAGTAGGVASLLAGHPFDTIKTRLQAQAQARPSSLASNSSSAPLLTDNSFPNESTTVTRQYKNATQAFKIIVREEKVLGLFKGVTSPMLGVALMNASIFGFYGLALRAQAGSLDPTLTQIFFAGCASGALSSFITAPIDVIKIREQMTPGVGARPSSFRVVGQIWREAGLKGVYRGLFVTSLRDLGYGSYFFTYELLNQLLLSRHSIENRSLSAAEMSISGGLAGVVAWVATFPLDTIKTQIQASTSKRAPSILETARSVYHSGGLKSFFVGVGPTIVRAIPVNAVLFLVFELTKDSLMKRGW